MNVEVPPALQELARQSLLSNESLLDILSGGPAMEFFLYIHRNSLISKAIPLPVLGGPGEHTVPGNFLSHLGGPDELCVLKLLLEGRNSKNSVCRMLFRTSSPWGAESYPTPFTRYLEMGLSIFTYATKISDSPIYMPLICKGQTSLEALYGDAFFHKANSTGDEGVALPWITFDWSQAWLRNLYINMIL